MMRASFREVLPPRPLKKVPLKIRSKIRRYFVLSHVLSLRFSQIRAALIVQEVVRLEPAFGSTNSPSFVQPRPSTIQCPHCRPFVSDGVRDRVRVPRCCWTSARTGRASTATLARALRRRRGWARTRVRRGGRRTSSTTSRGGESALGSFVSGTSVGTGVLQVGIQSGGTFGVLELCGLKSAEYPGMASG